MSGTSRSMAAVTVLLSVLLVSACGPSAGASPPPIPGVDGERDLADYYRDKTVTVIVPADPGGARDIPARMLQKYGAEYVPGRPRIVVQNVPGGAQLAAGRAIFQSAPDGLTLGGSGARWIRAALAGQPLRGFDPLNVPYIGATNTDGSGPNRTFLMCSDPAVARDWNEVLALGRPITVGALAPGASGGTLMSIMINEAGGPIRVVYGYSSPKAVTAAFSRGETEAVPYCDEAYVRQNPEWLERQRPFPAPLMYLGRPPQPEFVGRMGWPTPIPHVFDVPGSKLTDDHKTIIKALLEFDRINDMWFLPPGTPRDVQAVWVHALQAVAATPEYVRAMRAAGGFGGTATPDEIVATFDVVRGLTASQFELFQLLTQ